jgi:hypothetical protein
MSEKRTKADKAQREADQLEEKSSRRPPQNQGYLAEHDPHEAATHARPSTTAESDRVFAGRNADQAVDCRKQPVGASGLRILHALAKGETDPKKLAQLVL